MHLTPSRDWIVRFSRNAGQLLEIPWSTAPRLTDAERAVIIPSLQAWQLGETSEGAHLRAVARKYAAWAGDPEFPAAVDGFIGEEQRHGETLGLYLDKVGAPRIGRDWGDSMFRTCRYAIASMEIWVTVVIMVEVLALVYYAAIRRASQCPLLRRICQQILQDEVPHIRFQYERLAILLSVRPRWRRELTYLVQRWMFAGVVLAVWIGHRRALRAGGHTWASYWGQSWRKMEFAWQRMRPENFAELQPACPSVHSRLA